MPQEVVRIPGTGVTDDYKPPGECWELNSSPLQEQHVLVVHYFFFNEGWEDSVMMSCLYVQDVFNLRMTTSIG